MILLDGKLVAETRKAQLKQKITKFLQNHKRSPHLAVILVGEDPASQIYVGSKIKSCEQVGIESTTWRLPSAITQTELIQKVQELNSNTLVDAILVQMPLPQHIEENIIIEQIDPAKDVDCFTYAMVGRSWCGKAIVNSCTPKGVMSILEHYKILVEGKHALVIGRSQIVGKPMANLLLQASATVTIAHSKTQNLKELTQRADIVVVAAGKPHLLGKDYFKKGAVVIDVGIHRTAAGIVGDVKFDEVKEVASAMTPVPGGVGPMTIVTLLENTLALAESRV